MVRRVLLGMGGGVGDGPRKKNLTSRGKAEGLYEFPKIENSRFADQVLFHIDWTCFRKSAFKLVTMKNYSNFDLKYSLYRI